MTSVRSEQLGEAFAEIRDRVEAVLETFLHDKIANASADGLTPDIPSVLKTFIAGGKRLRPLLCVAGWLAACGQGLPDPLVRTAAALEMYQAFALIHDDVIDNSSTRRSRPAVHKALACRYASAPDPHQLGVSAAILIGDMALLWSHEIFNAAEIAEPRRATTAAIIEVMREEMHHGQYLDLLSTLQPLEDQKGPRQVIRYKTAKYTVERPLQIGAALAGGGQELLADLSRFALPLGDAFQLRDDLLGVFGDPKVTGKPVLDDLREGKRTVLMAIAAGRADGSQRKLLRRYVGDSELDQRGAARVIEVLRATGADAEVEVMIVDRYREALRVLAEREFPAEATALLREIARVAVERDS